MSLPPPRLPGRDHGRRTAVDFNVTTKDGTMTVVAAQSYGRHAGKYVFTDHEGSTVAEFDAGDVVRIVRGE